MVKLQYLWMEKLHYIDNRGNLNGKVAKFMDGKIRLYG
jgi:hypothetical protein